MKNFLTATFLVSTFSVSGAHALALDTNDHRYRICSTPSDRTTVTKVAFCTLDVVEWLTSAPTLLVLADEKEMGSAELAELLKAEAQNRVDGIEGDYLLLNKIAKDQGVTIDQVAEEVLK